MRLAKNCFNFYSGFNNKSASADKGFAPLFTDHEPVMFLLHQSAYISIKFV